MAKHKRFVAIPRSKYTSSRRRRARHVKVRIRMHHGGIGDPRRGETRPLKVREWTTRIDKALAAIARPPKPAMGYKRPVHDPRAKHQTPPTWHYGWIASSTEIAARTREAAA